MQPDQLSGLRERIDAEHRRAVVAYEVLSRYLNGSSSEGFPDHGRIKGDNYKQEKNDLDNGTAGAGRPPVIRIQVQGAMTGEFKTAKQIAAALGLSIKQVNGVIHSRGFTEHLLRKKGRGKVLLYKYGDN